MKLLKVLIFFFCVAGYTTIGYSQTTKIVTGKIIDESGNPLPGVNINQNKTKSSATSDFTGSYKIEVPEDATLSFSYLGYKTKTAFVNGRKIIDITLQEDAKGLNEVVVVGYGTQKKKVVTGSISSVKSKDLEDLPLTRIEQSLQGRVAGVTIASNSGQPGSSSTIRIRGLSTFSSDGSNEPLWVIDGIVIDGNGIGFLNQSDIESIEVLKDAASQAIYGTRGANGVILVTTKKGKSGVISVSYNGFSGLSSAAKKLDLLNARQYATLNNESNAAAGKPLNFSNPELLGAGTDWQKEIFNDNALRQSHEISISAGSEKSSAFLSFGIIEQDGIVTKDISNYKRKNIRLNSNHKLSDWLSIGQTLGYSNEKNIGLGVNNSLFGGPLSSAINFDPTVSPVVTDPALFGTVYNNPNIIRDQNGNPYGTSNIVGREITNPLAYVKTRLGNYNYADNFVGNVFFELSPIKNIKFKSTISGKLSYFGSEGFTPRYYFNPDNNNSSNQLVRQSNKSFGWNVENTILYSKKFNNHNVSLLLGQGAYVDNITSGQGITVKNLPVNNYLEASFGFNIPDADKTSYAYNGVEHRITSLFSRLTYDYKERYLFTGIIRRDGSTPRFGNNKKYGVFPSFSAGWVVSNEDFWKENNIVNSVKFRGGYGIVGNDAIGNFLYLSTISGGRNYTFGNNADVIIGNSPDAPSNPDLQWEETAQTNLGLDLVLFKNFNISVEAYNKKTTGILQPVTLPGYIGTTVSPAANVGGMENKGFEIELGYKKSIKNLNLSLNGNLTYLENKVTYLGENIKFIDGSETIQSSTYPITRIEVGLPVNSFYGFQTNGIFQNQAEIDNYKNDLGGLIQPLAKPGDFKWSDLNNDGKIDANDRKFLGSPLPKFTFGFTLNIDYKGFDMMIFAQGATGNKIFQGLRRLDVSNVNYQTKALARWTGEGTSNSYPRLTSDDTNKNFSNPSNFYLEDGDYLRFKIIQIGYSLPSSLLSKAHIKKVRLYLTGENLMTFNKYSGFDPEIGGNTLGIDKGFYPQAKSYMFGVNLQL
jgi:TonB-dependent starch-binding outer membrane protein SusC